MSWYELLTVLYVTCTFYFKLIDRVGNYSLPKIVSLYLFNPYFIIKLNQISPRGKTGKSEWVSDCCLTPIQRVDMSLHSDTLFWFRTNQSLLLLPNAACLAEKYQFYNFFGVWFEPTGAQTHDLPHLHWGKHAVYLQSIFNYYLSLLGQKKKSVFPIAWSSKLGSVGRDFFFFF